MTTATIDMDMLTEIRDQGIISNEDFEAQMAAAGLAQHTAPEEVEVELGDEQIGQVEGVIEAIEHREAVYNAQASGLHELPAPAAWAPTSRQCCHRRPSS